MLKNYISLPSLICLLCFATEALFCETSKLLPRSRGILALRCDMSQSTIRARQAAPHIRYLAVDIKRKHQVLKPAS